jgi:hypothetical protein
MKFKIKTFQLQIIFTTIGAIGGFLYWKFVGCNNGTCMIKSVWYWSTLWGAAVGFLIGDFIYGFLKKKKGGKNKE